MAYSYLKVLVIRIRRLFGFQRKYKAESVSIHCDTQRVLHKVSPYYLSFSIDISVLAGGFWWEGSNKVNKGLGGIRIPPLNLKSKKLNLLTAQLAPAYLRIGGSEADKIHYLDCPSDEPNALTLTRRIWDDLQGFLSKHELKLYFTVKYGLFDQQKHGCWHGEEVVKLIKYAKENGHRIDVCELGNELNAYWIFYGLKAQPKAKKLAQDYQVFSELMRSHFPDVKIAGPGSAFWPKLGETIKPFSNITERFLNTVTSTLDIIDWHYYPFQSTRTPIRTRTASLKRFLSPRSFQDFSHFSLQLARWRSAYQPDAEIWTGETGSAQCGGEAKLSDRFISCFWWADQLGQGASLGQSVMVRQSLIGGDYGMIDRLTLKPRPDYWVSWLWKRLMGEAVYHANSSNQRVRAYLHQHPDGIHQTLLLINLTSREQCPDVQGLGALRQQFALTARKLTSRKVRINGVRPKIKDPNLNLEALKSHEVFTSVSPFSLHFWVFQSR